MKGTVVGVDRLWVDPSPPGSVIVIAPLHLMIQGVPHRRLGVWSLAPLDSTGA